MVLETGLDGARFVNRRWARRRPGVGAEHRAGAEPMPTPIQITRPPACLPL